MKACAPYHSISLSLSLSLALRARRAHRSGALDIGTPIRFFPVINHLKKPVKLYYVGESDGSGGHKLTLIQEVAAGAFAAALRRRFAAFAHPFFACGRLHESL